ncbi:MAG: polysaccharide biosynthesis tyrosine autokinase [Thermodesulfobacteriota bacterium]|nr:polysaccharide biosynthesis tyrosine autokinase [Thermodesulfobacteriota bacterium]
MSRLEKALKRAKQDRDDKGASVVETRQKLTDLEHTQTRVEQASEAVLRKNGVMTPSIPPVIIEQYNVLRVRVLEALSRDGYKSLLVTSPGQGEGKTFTAVNLAVSLAREKTRTVLLIDTDLRRPAVHKYFGLSQGPGLYEHLTTGVPLSELLINPGTPRLTLLLAGKSEQYPSDFLNTPAMHSFVRKVKERYPDRYIIFDSPPLLGFSDALYLSRFADGVIIVVRSQDTKEADLKRSLEFLQDRHILGTVLNGVSSEFAEWRGYEKYYQ